MINGWLVFGIVMIYLLICVALGLLRGLARARFRTVTIAVSAIAALITTAIVKNSSLVENLFNTYALPMLQNTNAELAELLTLSPSLISVVKGMVTALAAPLLCFVFFVAYTVLFWIVYLIFAIIFRKGMKAHNEKSHVSLLRAGGAGLLHGLIVLFIIMIPIVTYLNVGAIAGPQVAQSGLLDEQVSADVQLISEDCRDLHDSFGIRTFRVLGVDALSNSLTSFKVNDNKISLGNEVGAIASLTGNVLQLTETEFTQYSEAEAEVFHSVADSFDQSVVLPLISGELIWNATDKWMNGEAFLGIEKPSMGEQAALFDPFMNEMIYILHTDAKNIPALQADVRTVANLISILARNGVFANIGGDTKELMTALSSEGVISSMVTTLGQNQSMKRLIPQITNLGIRVVGQTLGIPENVEQVYSEFIDDVTLALNDVRDESGAVQVQKLTEKLNTAFDEAGVDVDKEILDFYATGMVKDLIANNPNNEVTPNDVQAFFAVYADYASDNQPIPAQNANIPGVIVSSSAVDEKKQDRFAGSVYENMSEEDFANTAAAKIAAMCVVLATLEEGDSFASEAEAIVSATFAEMLGDDAEVLEHLMTVVPTKPLSTDSLTNTAGLQSSDEMNTQKVTMDTLLINVEEAVEKLTGESIELEADAITAMISSAGDLMNMDMDNMDFNSIAEQVGGILDSLNVTETFGSEKTAGLLTAVFQSETVRESANIDMNTATKMAQKATEGDVNYTQTLTTVSKSMEVLKSMDSEEELSEEELADLIRNINPQVAGMLEIYATPDRMVEFGTPEKYSEKSSLMMVSMFSYMGREDLPDYNAEAKALNQILNVALAARDGESKKVFSTEGQNDGRLPSQRETIDILMNSHAVTFAVVDVLTDGEKVVDFDPFGLGDNMTDEDSATFEQTLNEYYAEHPETDVLTMQAMAALFGLDIQF